MPKKIWFFYSFFNKRFGTLVKSNAPEIKSKRKNRIEFLMFPVIWSIVPNIAIPIIIPTFSVTS
jgi:hypothetical protein